VSTPPTLVSPLLSAVPGVRHAFFTRQGGVSSGIYESLNLGRGSGDDPQAVAENRRRAAGLFGVSPDGLNVCFQIHSATVVVAHAPWGETRPKADGVITMRPGLLCGALAADCAPVLIAEPTAGIVAAVHAGWRGALLGVVASAVKAMIDLGADPARMVAAVGPCIGQDSYEVGEEFEAQFEAGAPGSRRFFAPGATANKRQFDLPGFVLERLSAAGVGSAEWIGRDTCAEPQTLFSNRRAFHRGEADYGRLLSAIMLSP
jgi:hypothetical protein